MTLLLESCAALGELHIGSQIFRRFYIRDEDGVLTDSTFAVTLTGPDGNDVSLPITHEATGTYLAAFGPFTQRGFHDWRAASSGPVYQVETGRIRVLP